MKFVSRLALHAKEPLFKASYRNSFSFYIALLLFIGVFQVTAYRMTGVFASCDGSMPVPQPDALLYSQAAQRIADGHPFSFSEGEAVSTGTTSVLYPFVLAVPSAMGATGRSLLTAGFCLNAFFYLVFLIGWGIAFFKWLPGGGQRVFAAVLLALAVQPAYCAMAQSDTGMMMAVSAVLAAGLALEKRGVWGVALVLAPWVRPEGMMCVVGLGLFLAIREAFRLRGKVCGRIPIADLAWVALAVISGCGVFALNFALTGDFQFASVMNKGHFNNFPPSTAVVLTVSDAIHLVRSYFLGLPDDSFRDYYCLPLLAGVFSLIGVWSFLSRAGSRVWSGLLPVAIAVGLSFMTVASSGWQGTNFDRYLAWGQPLVILFLAVGVHRTATWVGGRARIVAYGIPILFFAVAAVTGLMFFHDNSRSSDRQLMFSCAANRLLPKGASVGGVQCGYAYMLGDRRFVHFAGLYSPSFHFKGRTDPAVWIEKLRYEPNERPEYLITENPDKLCGFSPKRMDEIGTQLMTGPSGIELRKAKWSLFDASLEEIVAPTGKTLSARVDVGYVHDEIASDFEIADRWNRRLGNSFVRIGKAGGKDIIDSGRVVEGEVSMSVPLKPGRDVVVVIRTLRKETARYVNGMTFESTEFEMDDHLSFNLFVDGRHAGHVHAHAPFQKDDDFTEFALKIDGRHITGEKSRITIDGDHIACAYRFYQ